MSEAAKGHADLVEPPRLTTYEMQVLLGTTISGCNMSPSKTFSLNRAWLHLYELGLVDRTDGLAIATEKGLALINRALSAPIAAHGAGAVTEAMIKRAARQITLVFQCHDLGYADDNGGFTCSAPQIALLERLSAEAAERVLLAALRPDEAAGQGEAKRQYYYRVTECEAFSSSDANCICWHDEGTGPLANMDTAHCDWRATPRPKASDAPDIVERQLRESAADLPAKSPAAINYLAAADALAALRAELAAAERVIGRLNGGAELQALMVRNNDLLSRAEAAEAEAARLKDENKELVAGLEPFAKMADQVDEWQKGKDPNFSGHFDANDLRRARSLTAAKGG